MRYFIVALTLCSLLTNESGESSDFEDVAAGEAPKGWFVPPVLRKAGWSAAATDKNPHEGKSSILLQRDPTKPAQAFGNLMRAIDATPYRGKRISFTAAVRVEGTDARAQLWLRVDREGGVMGAFDNMNDRPIIRSKWQEYEIIADVDDDARMLNFGLMTFGENRAWLDSVRLRIIEDEDKANAPPAALGDREMDHLVALARLFGYVRHFHPSDEAAEVNWNEFALHAVAAVEDARDADELCETLRKLFAPIAPTVEIQSEPFVGELDVNKLRPADATELAATVWVHNGFGQGHQQSPYRSNRERWPATDTGWPKSLPAIGSAVTTELPGGVWVRVPIVLFLHDGHTWPRGQPQTFQQRTPSGDDRITRLANVVILWNILQHFYPYFDVIECDWHVVLRQTLRDAAGDKNARAFLLTLSRMVAAIQDGHGRAMHPSAQLPYSLPFAWDWIEDKLIITAVPEGMDQPKVGDIVRTIRERAVEEEIAEASKLVSSPTPQWRMHLVLQEKLCRHTSSVPVKLGMEDTNGKPYVLQQQFLAIAGRATERRPDKIAELKPGVWYVDLDRITDDDFKAALGDLSKATGLIFDLRGYPSQVSVLPLAHITNEGLRSAQWHIPRITRPDRQRMTFQRSGWPVLPAKPRINAKVAFITDGRAISYAETYLGIVEHFKLGEIVGSTTAGTNGNVNPVNLPGGYTVMWTGMKVLKHDGSQHHGVGIAPTVPVKRTIEGVRKGKDELLERAIEVVTLPS